MPAAMVQRAIEQARDRDAFVHTAALVYGSRVLASLDKQAAKTAYAAGVTAADNLALSDHDREHFFRQIVQFGASVDPLAALMLFRRTLSLQRHPFIWESATSMLAQGLAKSGEFEAALELLQDPNCTPALGPEWTDDPSMRRRFLLAAREGWRARNRRAGQGAPRCEGFYRLYAQHWRALPREKAEALLDEIVDMIRSEPDQPTHSIYPRVQFVESHAASQLFQVLNVLQAIMPAERVHALLRAYPELERAAEIYPLGIESVMAEPRPARSASGFGFAMTGGDPAWQATVMSALRGDSDAVKNLLEDAHQALREDTDPGNPNLAPRVFWPSCGAYKAALYHAGRLYGSDAESRLDEIPDRDFQLLSRIEMAAGIAGLSYMGGFHMSRRQPRGAGDYSS